MRTFSLEWKGFQQRERTFYPEHPLLQDLLFYKGVISNIRDWAKFTKAIKDVAEYSKEELESREQAFIALHGFMCDKYQIAPKLEFRIGNKPKKLSNGMTDWHGEKIVLMGKFSLITYLHEFAHARGMGETEAVVWSLSLFKRCFPKTFATLKPDGYLMRREK